VTRPSTTLRIVLSALLLAARHAVSDRAAAVAHYEKGIQLAERQFAYRAALDAFDRAYAEDPTLVEALVSSAECYGALGELRSARERLALARAAPTLNPTLKVRVLTTLGRLALLQGDFADAESVLLEARSAAPTSAQVAQLLGDAYAKRGNLDAAAAEYARAIGLDDKSVLAHRGMASVAVSRGDTEATIRHAEAAIALDPFDSATLYRLAQAYARDRRTLAAQETMRAYREMKEYESDIEAIEKAIAATPGDLPMILSLAERHAAMGNIEPAVDAYLKLVVLGADASVAMVNVGLLRLRQERYADAEKAFADAQRLAPDTVPPYLGMGELHAAREEWRAAADAFREAIRREPALDAAHIGRIGALQHAGDPRAAIAAMDDWVEMSPESSHAWEEWARLRYQMGNRDAALEGFERSMSLDPGNLEAANDLAWLYADAGSNLDRALALAKSVAEREPTANAFDTLAFVHRKRNELADALRALERALTLEPDNADYVRRAAELRALLSQQP